MRVTAKKYSVITKAKVGRLVRRRAVTAARTIRRTGSDWARKWNTGQLDEVVAAYAEDAAYLPPHHEAVHGRDAIREYLERRLLMASPTWHSKSRTSSNKGASPGTWEPTT